MAFDLRVDVSMRVTSVESGAELAQFAQFAGDFGLRIRTEPDPERRGWIVVIDSGRHTGADLVIQALVYARALASTSTVSKVLNDARHELTRKTGLGAEITVGDSGQHE